MGYVIKVTEYLDKPSAMVLSHRKAACLGIEKLKRGFVSFGAIKHFVSIIIEKDMEENNVFLSSEVMEHLHMPAYAEYEITVNCCEIILGPCIGILAYRDKSDLTEKRLSRMLSYVLEYKRLHGAVIVFALNQVDPVNKLTEGFCFNPLSGKWQSGIFPYPMSIYRRIGINEYWKNHFLSSIGDKVFNNYYFDKWEMHCWLSSDNLIKNHLPCTEIYNSYEDIISMLQKYDSLIIKPISGMRGNKVSKLSLENGKFTFNYREGEENKVVEILEPERLIEYIDKNFQPGKFLIQQYIELLRQENSIMDFRVIMQKNQSTNWVCNGIIGRVGAKDSVVSNISSSGIAYNIDNLLRKILNLSETEIFILKEKICSFSLKVCKSLDNFGINCGTVGLDLGIDVRGNLWLIEINNRDPDPTIALDINDKMLYLTIKSAPLFYAKALSGFKK